MPEVKVGDRIRLNGNGDDFGRVLLNHYASGIVINVTSHGFIAEFDCGHFYAVRSSEAFEIIDKPEKVVFT